MGVEWDFNQGKPLDPMHEPGYELFELMPPGKISRMIEKTDEVRGGMGMV